MILFLRVGTNQEIKAETTLIVMGEHASTSEGLMAEVTAQHLARNAKNAEEKTTLKPYVKVVIETQTRLKSVQTPEGKESQKEKKS